MAFTNDQTEPSLPADSSQPRKSVNHLPKYFRTEYNQKFLSTTLDQMIQPGKVEQLNGFYGRRTARAFDYNKDIYVKDITQERQDYQLEPVIVQKDELNNLNYYADYVDFINSLKIRNGSVVDHNVINGQEYYAWNPHIDWDKFVNFRNYYWLPNGPVTLTVSGQEKEVESEYTIRLQNNADNFTYIFTPDGLTNNPTITLYRGQTYVFDIDTPNYPIAFVSKKTFTPGREYNEPTENTSLVYTSGLVKKDENGVTTDETFLSKGVFEFTVPDNSPDVLYYISKDDPNLSGSIKIYDIIENTEINVEKEVIGKKNYKTSSGWKFSNGMKVEFAGNVFPAIYGEGEWYVEGVGTAIKLINTKDLELNSLFVEDIAVEFDDKGFDDMPFDEALGYPVKKDYIVINKASNDGNLWSKYNRWFHIDVIEKSLEINQQIPSVDQSLRANRPIIEFEPNIKLHQFGTQTKQNVNLVDTITKDVFSTIEGSIGYNIDGIDLTEGMRILFLNDNDIFVKNKIFKVFFVNIKNNIQITLKEETDAVPLLNENVLITQGNQNKGKYFYYDGETWHKGQEKYGINQSPLFDMYDEEDVWLKDLLKYQYSQFIGNRIFSYAVGQGNNDSVLGFPLKYQNIENSGDIVFNFDLLNSEFSYYDNNSVKIYKTDTAFLRKYYDKDNYELINGWEKANTFSQQDVILQLLSTNDNMYALDMYESIDLNDFRIKVFVDNRLQVENVDYQLITNDNNAYFLTFIKQLPLNSNIVVKTRSSKPKTASGFYEIPASLEKNPSNDNLYQFTLGEVNDHVGSIVEELTTFTGNFPGIGNLRDLGNLSSYGKKFLKHSALYNLYSYHILDKQASVMDAISFAQKEYAKFKRLFLQTISTIGFQGETQQTFEKVLEEIVKGKSKDLPYYFSDMIPYAGKKINSNLIVDVDQQFFPLSSDFNLDTPSTRAVLVYKNEILLLYGVDYDFSNPGFVRVFGNKEVNDVIDVYEFENTFGSFVPQTPTKLGLFPKYAPRIYIDDSVVSKQADSSSGPFKIYGYTKKEGLGWYHPIFTDYAAAKEYDKNNSGNGEVSLVKFDDVPTVFYMPMSSKIISMNDTEKFDSWHQDTVIIQGHDGSKISAFKDYRDTLILELETRIYNNIKVNYDSDLFDLHKILPSFYRKNLIKKENLYNAMLNDFVNWTKLINIEYSPHLYFDLTNPYTYNYASSFLENGQRSPGWWRAIYEYVYDTDRPHTHPWEMLGFTGKPDWWDAQYGTGPYTNNNLPLWQDLENGIIRKPFFKIDERFSRPGLSKIIPVDENGKLLNPAFANVIKEYNRQEVQENFKFGDGGPVETAWKRTSEYPFSLLKASILLQPAYVFSGSFDRIQQKRNIAGQIIYNVTKNHIQLSSLQFPDEVSNMFASGLINYIVEYQNKHFLNRFNEYVNIVKNLKNQLGFKVGGFTDKSKFKLILDSRSPLNKGNVFVPDENYDVYLNTSFPINEFVYSGVLIQKESNGFLIKGYDENFAKFPYYKPNTRSSNATFNVGGISETFVTWDSGKTYAKDTIVKVDNVYYRTKITHVSGDYFDTSRFTRLPRLPLNGGAEAKYRHIYDGFLSYLDYGTLLTGIQDVVDFLFGYGHYLETVGFKFEKFLANTTEISDWVYSIKQFLFWTTQNWGEGSIITLSPAADEVKFQNDYAVVGNTLESSIGFSVLKADGTVIPKENCKFFRDTDNSFSVKVVNYTGGIYFIKIPLVTKEHIVLIDNTTIFNDIIYDPTPGYRQERIKVAGYRTANWNGSLNIPGFFYDTATVKNWTVYTDYNAGDVVKFKEFYYTAKQKIFGSDKFEFNRWKRLDETPQAKLYSNFDYKIEQFKDFYDLDSDNLDTNQQKIAQHLIGYQKRKYLENIINSDVSQYKFYQGYIQEKGTKNAFTKLFDVLASSSKDSLEFYEEWGVRVGHYGGTEIFDEFDYILKENDFNLKPQPVVLTNTTSKNIDYVNRIKKYETYNFPPNYDHKPFPVLDKEKIDYKTSGYVFSDDVHHVKIDYLDLLQEDITSYNLNDIIWTGNTIKNDWSVYQVSKYKRTIVQVINGEVYTELHLDGMADDLNVDDIIGIYEINSIELGISTVFETSKLTGFFKIIQIDKSVISIDVPDALKSSINYDKLQICKGIIVNLQSVRVNDLDSLASFSIKNPQHTRLWLDDDGQGNWKVLEKGSNFVEKHVISNPIIDFNTKFGVSVATNSKNTVMIVGAPNDGDGKVYLYKRDSYASNWKFLEVFEPDAPTKEEVIVLPINGQTIFEIETNLVQHIKQINVNSLKVNSTEYTLNLNANQVVFANVIPKDSQVIFDFNSHTIPYRFGSSIDIAEDGNFLIIGAPDASNVLTRYEGDFDNNTAYNAGSIVKYNGLYWEASIDISPGTSAYTFESFFSVSNFLAENNLDLENSPKISILLTGNYPFTYQQGEDPIITDHFLVRLKQGIYDGIAKNDEIILKWNKLTNANQTQIDLTATEPFEGNLTFVNDDTLLWSDVISRRHTVQEKVDIILQVDNALFTPQVGDTVTSTTGIGTIVYVYRETPTSNNFLIYVNDVRGYFETLSYLEIDTILLGDYQTVTPEDSMNSYFGGYAMISVDEYYLYLTNSDAAKGLVITETITDSSDSDLYFYNILDYPNNSLITILSYKGTAIIGPGNYNDIDSELRYIGIRAPQELSNTLNVADGFSFYYNQLRKTVTFLRVRNTRFTFPPVVEKGEIITQKNTNAYATVFSNEVVEDPDSVIAGSFILQVQFLSQNENGPVFDFTDELVGSVSGELFCRPIANPVEDIYTSIQEIGIQEPDQLNANDNSKIVWNIWDGFIDYNENRFSEEGLPYQPYPKYYEDGTGFFLTDAGRSGQIIREKGTTNTAEVVYLQRLNPTTVRVFVDNLQGEWGTGTQIEMLAITSNIPTDPWNRPNIYSVNREIGTLISQSLSSNEIGKLVILENSYNISVAFDSSGLPFRELKDQEYWIYKNETVDGIDQLPEIPNNLSRVWNETYNIPIDNANGTPSVFAKEGAVYVYAKVGAQYLLQHTSTSINKKDNHRYGSKVQITKNNDFYTGYILALDGDFDFDNPGKIYFIGYGDYDGRIYNWDSTKNKNYRGEFNELLTYFKGDIVYVDKIFYEAKTNLLPNLFNVVFWTPIEELIDFVGYIPNDLNLPVTFDGVDISTIPMTGIYDYATNFAVSKDGEVLAVFVKYDIANPNVVAIYRRYENTFTWSQNINAQTPASAFGESLELNEDGTLLFIGAPKDDSFNNDGGVVYIYKLDNLAFNLYQIIYSPYSHTLEMFGHNVKVSNNILAVTSLNGDRVKETTFDDNNTIFDNNFTKISYTVVDTGVIHFYSYILDKFVYSHNISYEDGFNKIYQIGDSFILNNNSLFLGVNDSLSGQSIGNVIQFDKGIDNLYNVLREIKSPVDVSKIKKITLYDKRKNKVITNLDFIDPLQNKIPGPAEQNITYKLLYDPAVYNVGNINIDQTMAWNKDQVGQLWWDLTNVKYYYPYLGDVEFSSNYWAKLFPTHSIDIYEWVQSDVLPEVWDELTGTVDGTALGITGTTKYGSSSYSTARVYDTVVGTFFNQYFFWVKNKTSIPQLDNRSLSAAQVSNLMSDPIGQDYSFIGFISENEFACYNLEKYLNDDNIIISFQIYNDAKVKDINQHLQYKLITENYASSLPNEQIEQKWIDSLVGYDLYGRSVPDPSVSLKYRYGVLDDPRQGMFKNRQEALKQYIEYINLKLKSILLKDNKNLSNLYSADEYPTEASNLYDIAVDLRTDLDSIGIAKAEQAEISLKIVNGIVIDFTILQSGRGYLVKPTYLVIGKGDGLEIDFDLNSLGGITNFRIINGGVNYNEGTYIIIRKFTALVKTDESILGKWALYERNYKDKDWVRVQSQGYDTSLYWNFIDWYANGFSSDTRINYTIDQSYELTSLKDNLNDIIKISNIGDGTWLLLRKINNLDDVDYTVNYETIGRQNGTIQFSRVLYDPNVAFINFDLISYDTNFYDSIPSLEIREIAKAIKNDIFIDDLAIEYNKLFFATLRYVLSEQPQVDWLFKSNFLKIVHNVGELKQEINFKNDNLESYEDYVNEVKPYKVKIREFISSYEKVDDIFGKIEDFDLPPKYSTVENKIVPWPITAFSDGLYNEEIIQSNPYKSWLDNCTYEVVAIEIHDGGSGYSIPPVLRFEGGGGNGCIAKARIGDNGSLVMVDIINSGSGYFSAPKLIIDGSIGETGRHARASVILGNGLPRSIFTNIKFDRNSKKFEILALETSENFIGTGSKYIFDLLWPLSLNSKNISVIVNGNKLLRNDYTYRNILDKSKSSNYFGQIIFAYPVANYSSIQINYYKDSSLLKAQDRINLLYTASQGQYGNDLALLMDGVDYGGVEVKSFEFGTYSGWDTSGYLANTYDTYDENYNDTFYRIPAHLLDIDVLDYKVHVNFINIANAVNAIVKGDSTAILKYQRFIEIFSVDQLGNALDNYLDGSSILNILDELIEVIDEDGNINLVSALTFKSSDQFQKYAIGTANSLTAITNIELQIIPKLVTLPLVDVNQLLVEGILEDLIVKFVKPLENNISYNVYYNNLRIDDPNYIDDLTPVGNPNATMTTIIGDGITQSVNVKNLNISPNTDDIIIVRSAYSDGSFLPTDLDYDTLLLGGNIDYSNAKGIDAADIIVDGDNFVTPLNSKGPEELVPGLIKDSVSITVYERPTAGTSNIVSRNYIGDGNTTLFSIDFSPITEFTVFVKVNRELKKVNEDYTVDFRNQNILFITAPPAYSKINITTLDYSGSNILDVDTITIEESLGTFIVNARWEENLSSQVSVNGQSLPYELVKADTEFYDSSNNILIKFANPLPVGSVLQYLILSGEEQSYSTVYVDEFVADGSTNTFTLAQAPFRQRPLEWHTMVIVNDKLLNPGYVETFITTNALEYKLRLYQVPVASVSSKNIRVFLNGSELEALTQWTFLAADSYDLLLDADEQFGSVVILKRGISQPGDILKVYINAWDDSSESGGDYKFGYYEDGFFVETPDTVTINLDLNIGDKIKIYQFSNHNTQDIDWQSFDVTERTRLSPGVNQVTAIRRVTSTFVLELDFELNTNLYYAVYRNGTRIDDKEYGTSNATNPNAEIQTLKGNATYTLNLIDYGIQANEGDVFKIVELGSSITVDAGAADWYELRQLRNGIIPLNKTAIDDQFVWVAKNGVLLDPSVDYYVMQDRMRVRLNNPLQENDNIQVVHFSNSLQKNKFGWIQFNDILNKTHYLSLDGKENIKLAKDLYWYDKIIEVVDGSVLPQPETNSKYPGVVLIQGERIEFRLRNGNILSQLKRGTLGTGVKDVYPAGLEIYNQSLNMVLPYKDETLITSFISDGQTKDFHLDFVANSINEFEVFVAGRRLRKTEILQYNIELGPNSPNAGVILPPEFALDNNMLNLLEIPQINQKIMVVRKIGKLWTDPGVRLSDSDNNISKKIQSVQADLPR